jgi:dolichol-phosphate mannosyltransferase
VVVVDDGSQDDTGAIAAAIPGCTVVRHARNTHIPEGIRDGFRYALAHGYAYAVTMDAGLSHDPDALSSLLAVPPADLVLSYRRERRGVAWYRRALSWGARHAVGLVLRRGGRPAAYCDVTSGYRRYSRRAMQAVLEAPMACRSFDFHFEALAVVHYAGLGIRETPISYTFTNSSLSWQVVRQALATWWRLARGLHRRATP